MIAAPPAGADPAFQPSWPALAAHSPLGVFATPEWFQAVQAAFASGRVELFEARSEVGLVGVAPLRYRWRLPLRVVSFASMGPTAYGLADYGGIVAAPGSEREAARQTVSRMLRGPAWDIADFQQVPDGITADALCDALRRAGLPVLAFIQNLCHRMILPATWEDYRSLLSANTREWLERKPRKLEREVGATLELVSEADVMAEHANLRRFVEQRFGIQHSDQHDLRLRRLMASWLPAAARSGYLRMFRLRAGNRTLGVLLGYELGGTFYFHISGYDQDPAYASYSLGACLLSGSIRWSLAHRLQAFDFMRGNYAYKSRLGSTATPNHRILAFRSRLLAATFERALPARAQTRGLLRRLTQRDRG